MIILGNTTAVKKFSFSEEIIKYLNRSIPSNRSSGAHQIIASIGDFSDGEQNAFRVLSNRMMLAGPKLTDVGSVPTKPKTFSFLGSFILQHH
jgi:hypothetical protein